jgi:hypothetical protein
MLNNARESRGNLTIKSSNAIKIEPIVEAHVNIRHGHHPRQGHTRRQLTSGAEHEYGPMLAGAGYARPSAIEGVISNVVHRLHNNLKISVLIRYTKHPYFLRSNLTMITNKWRIPSPQYFVSCRRWRQSQFCSSAERLMMLRQRDKVHHLSFIVRRFVEQRSPTDSIVMK